MIRPARANGKIRLLAVIFVLSLPAAALYGGGSGEKSAPPELTEFAAPGDGAPGGAEAAAGSGWIRETRRGFDINIIQLILVSLFALLILSIFILVRGISGVVAESAALKLDAAALVTGDLMPHEKKRRMVRVKKRVSGLRVKLAAFTMAMVLAVDLMASVPLYMLMIRNQRQTLIQGLLDRSLVLLEGLAANAKVYLSQGNVADMNLLPAQMVSVPESLYVTITGYNPETFVFDDTVWATNDPGINRKIGAQEYLPGRFRISDDISPAVPEIADELNASAGETLSGIPKTIVDLQEEIRGLTENTGTANLDRIDTRLALEEARLTLRILETRVTEVLTRLERGIHSEPEYSPGNFTVSENGRYLFFKPIMLRLGQEDSFVWGFVRVEVSVNSILDRIAEERNNLFRINSILTVAALLIGVIVALILSALIIRPIRRLVEHVEIIRDTEDKAKLSGLDIKLKSHDELAILGDTINDMTHGLINAAFAASDLSVGKEIQKKFLPLNLDQNGDKLSFGLEETMFLNIFGYYEGARGVSGDYFDFQDLDGRYYAIIKCDVAGKGIPASFIMIQVATMFLNYFKKWEPTEKGLRIEDLVYEINEFLENLTFRDRFAAFSLCLYDSYTGKARFCNAGDNIINLYDASEKKFKILALPETPAAGMFTNIMVESKGGYRVQTITLDHGDILLLFTDGIEEAKRKFRNADFEEIVCEAGSIDTPHENHTAGQRDEELGHERVTDIINAVMNRRLYTLRKWHNPEGEGKELYFDFRSAKGSVEEVIMALVAVEKIFRCYYNPKASEEDRVPVDKNVDAFLKRYFIQYRDYCSFTRENPTNSAFMYYTHVMEDEQYDDLTILGLKRK